MYGHDSDSIIHLRKNNSHVPTHIPSSDFGGLAMTDNVAATRTNVTVAMV